MRGVLRCGLLAASVAAAFGAQAGAVRTDDQTPMRPTGRGWGQIDSGPGATDRAAAAARVRGFGIQYHGGPVMGDPGGVNVYYIWYGNWAGNTAVDILGHLAANIGGSPYFNINTTYTDGTGARVPNKVNFVAQASDNYSRGTALTDGDILAIVQNAIPALSGTPDPKGVYFVLTSQDVNETSGFCTAYCGWHTMDPVGTTNVKYSFIGNPARCPSACTNGTASPNGNVGADGMASIITHELEEAASDPELNAWYDFRGGENADKCAWTFGTTYTTANGGLANMKIGARDFLIQQNWVNAKGATGARGYCDVKF